MIFKTYIHKIIITHYPTYLCISPPSVNILCTGSFWYPWQSAYLLAITDYLLPEWREPSWKPWHWFLFSVLSHGYVNLSFFEPECLLESNKEDWLDFNILSTKTAFFSHLFLWSLIIFTVCSIQIDVWNYNY